MRVVIAVDHSWFALNKPFIKALRQTGQQLWKE
jgi:hypothetical protein